MFKHIHTHCLLTEMCINLYGCKVARDKDDFWPQAQPSHWFAIIYCRYNKVLFN